MKKTMVLILFSAVSISAFAVEKSQTLYQAEKGEALFQGSFNQRSFILEATGTNINFSDMALDLMYEYGFKDDISGYVSVGYGKLELSTVGGITDGDGLDLLHVGAKYQSLKDGGRLFAQADLGHALEEGNGDNRVSGETVLTLALGYEKEFGKGLLGGFLSYAVVATDSKEKGSPDSENDGDLNLMVFYESQLESDVTLGYKFGYSVASVNYWQNLHNDNIEFGSFILGVFTVIPYNQRTELLAGLDYRKSVDEPSGVKSFSGADVRIGFRRHF